MDYQKIYNQIVQKAISLQEIRIEKFLSKEEYFEGHHIIPKCLGGEGNSQSWKSKNLDKRNTNIVGLTAREHFLCHWLLSRIHPNNYKIVYAFASMCKQNKGGNRITSSNAYSEVRHRLNLLESPLKGRVSPLKGKPGHSHTDDTKEFLRNVNLGRQQSEYTRDKKSISAKQTFINGRVPANKGTSTPQSVKDKISKKLKGRVSNRKGCTLTDDQKQKMSAALIETWKNRKNKNNEESIIHNE